MHLFLQMCPSARLFTGVLNFFFLLLVLVDAQNCLCVSNRCVCVPRTLNLWTAASRTHSRRSTRRSRPPVALCCARCWMWSSHPTAETAYATSSTSWSPPNTFSRAFNRTHVWVMPCLWLLFLGSSEFLCSYSVSIFFCLLLFALLSQKQRSHSLSHSVWLFSHVASCLW